MSLYLGIDLGGTKTAIALGNARGEILAKARRPTEATSDSVSDLKGLAKELRELVERAGHTLSEIAAVGAAVPGPLDPDRGVLIAPPNLPWREARVAEVLGGELGVPVHLENDASAAALAEWRFGAAEGRDHAIYLTMSTGVGGGLILGGALHRGVAASAGEWGHMPVEWEGEVCGCGLRGCLEAYIGGANWARRVRRDIAPDALIARLAGGVERISAVHIVEAAKQGDVRGLSEMAFFNKYLTRAIVTLVFGLAPQVVVLGTIAIAAGDLCFGPLRAAVAQKLWPVLASGLEIVPAALGDELPYVAGICAALEAPGASASSASSNAKRSR